MVSRAVLKIFALALAVALLPEQPLSYPDNFKADIYASKAVKDKADVIRRLPHGRTPESARELGLAVSRNRGWFDKAEWICLVELWDRESNWRYQADNPSSSAYGIAQVLKTPKTASPLKMIRKGLDYIESRYKTPCEALKHHNQTGWY